MNKSELIYQLKAAFDGEEVSESHAEVGGIKGVYEPETNTVRFKMDSTDYTIADLNNAIGWIDKELPGIDPKSNLYKNLHISKCAIKALINDFTLRETTIAKAIKVGRQKSADVKNRIRDLAVYQKSPKDQMHFLNS